MIHGTESSSFGFSHATGHFTPIHSHIGDIFAQGRTGGSTSAPRHELQPTDRSDGELTRHSQEADCGR